MDQVCHAPTELDSPITSYIDDRMIVTEGTGVNLYAVIILAALLGEFALSVVSSVLNLRALKSHPASRV